jgi:exosortase
MRLLIINIFLLWLQLFWVLVPTWRNGEYYSYGWFVPVLAVGLAWRRWQLLVPSASQGAALEQQDLAVVGMPGNETRLAGWVAAFGVIAVVCMIPLQLIAVGDPGWRPPILLQAFLTVVLTHLLIWQGVSGRVSLGLLPVTIFALSAVPYPWQIEQQIIRSLTGAVVHLSREVFLLTGQPVELLGERLSIGSDAVDVTDGCSGIRSFQSLVMGALFFGELLLLSLPKRLALLAVAGVCALCVNSGRAYTLAVIHFDHGKEAAAAAHDLVGHVAYWLSIAIVFLAARWLVQGAASDRRVVRRSKVTSNQQATTGNLKNVKP